MLILQMPPTYIFYTYDTGMSYLCTLVSCSLLVRQAATVHAAVDGGVDVGAGALGEVYCVHVIVVAGSLCYPPREQYIVSSCCALHNHNYVSLRLVDFIIKNKSNN